MSAQLTGGNFANGAMTAAFAHMFNAHSQKLDEQLMYGGVATELPPQLHWTDAIIFLGPANAAIFGAARFIGSRLVARGGTTVIGRVKDLQKLKPGGKSLLDRLPDKGSPRANWKQNSGVLRQEMSRGRPIRDASPGDTSGRFLNAERNLLKNRGWTFDKSTGFWNPPK